MKGRVKVENLYVMERTKKAAKRRLSARARWILRQLCTAGMVLGFVFFIVYAGGESIDGGFHLKERILGVAASVGAMILFGWLEGKVDE